MNQNLITLQFGPLSYAYGNAFFNLESDQFYECDDPMDHNSLFKNLATKTPRNIAWGHKDAMDILSFYCSASLDTKNKKGNSKKEMADQLNPIESLLWSNDKVEVIKTSKEDEEEMKNEDGENNSTKANQPANPFYQLFKETQFDRKYQVELPFLLDSKFEAFQEGTILAKGTTIADLNEDKLRLMLEETDYLGGFQVFVDADSGFGGLCNEVLDIVGDECGKQPIITFSLYENDSKIKSPESTKSFVNEIISLNSYREKSSILVPIMLPRLSLFNQYINYNSEMTLFNKSMIMGNILSGLTGGYRVKQCEGLREYAKNIVGYPENNIFNSTWCMPMVSDAEGTLTNTHIFDFQQKRDQFNYLYHDFNSGWNYEEWGNPESFGEGYFLRGSVKMPQSPPKSRNLSLRMIDALTTYKTNLNRHLFAEQIQQTYLFQLDYRENYHQFDLPLHSAIFSNEQFSTKVSELIKRQSALTKANKIAYYNLDYNEEDFGEMKNSYQNLYESYAKNVQIEGDNNN